MWTTSALYYCISVALVDSCFYIHTMVPYLDKGYFGGTVSLPSFRVPWAFRGGTADKYSDLVKAITDEYDMLEAQMDNRL